MRSREARSSLEEREGVFLSNCFFPLLMAIHGDLLMEAWMDPGNPGNPVSAETVNAFKARLVLSINTCISSKYIYYVSSIVYCNTHIDFMKTCIDLIMHVFIYLTLADRYSSSDS